MAVNFRSLRLITSLNRSVSVALAQQKTTSGLSTIIMTTFSGRFFEFAIPSLNSFRESALQRDFYLVINGDQDGDFDRELRHKFLVDASKQLPVQPICFGSGRGMSELWNAGARMANAEKLIFIGEDLLIQPPLLQGAIEAIEAGLDNSPLVILNDSFGHFGIRRSALQKVGWFDERFLGFGEEDGDIYWRVRAAFPDEEIMWLSHPGLNNISANSGYEAITSNDGNKYSAFNAAFLRAKYQIDANPANGGGFQANPSLRIQADRRYTDEDFRTEFQHLLFESDRDLVEKALETWVRTSS